MGSQRFVATPQHHLLLAGGHWFFCIDAGGGHPLREGRVATMWRCQLNRANEQFWHFVPETGELRAGHASGPAYELCLYSSVGASLQLRKCDGSAEQRWDMRGEGSMAGEAATAVMV